jgi:hypothetical protein
MGHMQRVLLAKCLVRTLLLAACACVIPVATAQAALLGLIQQLPEIDANGFNVLDYVYNGTQGTFTATGGLPVQFYDDQYPDGVAFDQTELRSFDLVAHLTSDGSLIDGSLSITGVIPGKGVSGTLLTGTLNRFGCGTDESTYDFFEFVCNVTGGTLAQAFGGAGGKVGVKLDAFYCGFLGSFAESFGNSDPDALANSWAQTFGITAPEPCSMALSLTAAITGILTFARRRRRIGQD